QVVHVLLVIDLVEHGLVVVRDVHPDQIQRMRAHLYPSWRASIAHMARAGAALVVVALMGVALTCEAQDLEPRAYSNTPVGMNFLILGYIYTRGDAAFH